MLGAEINIAFTCETKTMHCIGYHKDHTSRIQIIGQQLACDSGKLGHTATPTSAAITVSFGVGYATILCIF